MAEMQWYYARNDEQFGPVSATDLHQLADAGRLSPDDLLWREGMDAWTTAINLRGLFADDAAAGSTRTGAATLQSKLTDGVTTRSRVARGPVPYSSLSVTLRATQVILWIMCVLVVLVGVVLFTLAFLAAKDAGEEAAAAAMSSTFFIGAYVLARCGEKLSRLLLAMSRARRRAR